MAQKKSNDGMTNAQKAGIGFGLTAAAVTAAGAYFLYGSKHATQNRKKVKGWVLKAKGEVLEALEKAEHITEAEYKALVDTASNAYGTVKNATAGEVKDFKKEMNDHWSKLQKSKAVKKVVSNVIKATGKAPANQPRPASPAGRRQAGKAVAKAAPKKAPAKKVAKK